ncbi:MULTISPECIES: DUF3696 domain-containing protein [Vibrio]|uniref:DUF3696 domain-containing protein n=1 Tax=Vibrio TaxID=662 RepID=UPI0011234541|nr:MULTISPECIES: DUF3696 domain-containing protein [Vibrio harveyi group]EHJ9960667.1 DUF3696 domain-containing protein [Vibrio parahaemolyticus]EHJ9962307.1 DUF3696 domain-containing protein [Vibrio parahaemolyticus]EJS4060544.1 DUF3696 domain-containing protein [Vibrio parahaemolyticus]MCS0265499.1 DUF3696 domain-containing protein [Vibrio alginolyticus]MEA5290823.1 DUF3696 domain-containing protein [Vibrio parahaemolyticus]
MINHLYLKNFKCFSEQPFSLAPLTIFCGSNSAGKSTAIQSILSLKQNIKNINNSSFRLDGELFNFGKLQDLLSHNPIDKEIKIELNDFKIKFYAEKLDNKECLIEPENIEEFSELTTLFSADFVYLCAERFGPRSSFELGPKSDILDVGIYGQFALSCYHDNQDQPASNQKFAERICSHLIDSSSEKKEVIFTDALVREAMRRVCPGFSMKVIEADEIDRVYNMYTSGSESIRPVNVGFGVSYVLPIVISASLIKPGGILIVENPEVHLHPRAQSELVKILCELSKCDVQVIIETHSDHIVNGVRVFAKDNDFSEENNIIHSVSEKSGKRVVKKIHIDSDGNFTALDDGFFDQINKDLMRLF